MSVCGCVPVCVCVCVWGGGGVEGCYVFVSCQSAVFMCVHAYMNISSIHSMLNVIRFI